jgi:hypothetical protein
MVKLYKLEPKAAALAPARQRLQDLLDRKAACEQRAQQLRKSQQSLVAPIEDAAKASAALAAFDRGNAEAMTAWARRELKNGDMPIVDSDARQALITAKAVAAETAAAAQAASAQLATEIHAEDMAAKSFAMPIEAAIAEILVETATGPLLDELREAVAVAVGKQVRVKAAFDELVRIAHSGPHDVMKPVFVMMEAFSETLRLAAAPPAPDGADDRLAWAKFSMALRADCTSEIEG